MKEVEELHFRIVDKGLFLPVALRLARTARKVSYWTPADKAFRQVRDEIGQGYEGIERVDCYLQDLDDVDCFCFPDVGFSLLQEHLRDLGIPVWGQMGGDELELNRGKFLATLKEVGLTVPSYEVVQGISALREHLRNKTDHWIKISEYRGDWETFHWRGEEDEAELRLRGLGFGPFAEQVRFYVFEPIEAEVEDGCDTYCVDGELPSLIIHGMEAKDKAYLGTFQRFVDMPAEVRESVELFAPVLREYGYRAFFSNEVRITADGKSYFIDPTCRCGSPPSQVQTEMIGNYGEIIWQGANGNLVEPDPAARFGVQALCDLHRDAESWTFHELKPELQRWLKSANSLMSGDRLCLPPNPTYNHCQDWLVGIGDTMEEAITHLKHNAELLPSGTECHYLALTELLREVQEAEEQGMEFTPDQVPEPSTVVED